MPRRPVLIAGIVAVTGAAIVTVAAVTTAVSHGTPARAASAAAVAPSSRPSSSVSPGPAGPAAAAPAATGTTPGAASAPAGSATTVPARSVTTAPRPPATPTTAGAGAGAVHSSSPAVTSAGPQPAAPGTYHYRQVGSLPGTPSQGTLVVGPASASGTQTWTRVVGGTVGPSSSVMRFTSAGAFLVSPGNQAAGGAASCSFAAPVPWPPFPTTPGQRTSGHATCTGGITSYQVSGVVQGMATDSLDGQPVTTSVVVYTIALSGNVNGTPLNVTVTETDHYSATLRVPVVTQTHLSGTALGLAVTTDRTDTLVSATPS